jgi:orotidine-5'-phosphate decarboxylase
MSASRSCELIAALDVPDRAAAEALVARLGGAVSWLKIGLELFTAEGPEIVRALAGAGHRIMLDLKLHDIPETVERATRSVAGLGVELLTVHTAGGPAMMQAAARAAAAAPTDRPLRLLGVTVLTSLDEADLRAIGDGSSSAELVARRADLAVAAGLHGVVASVHEAAAVRARVPASFLVVTPGVRPAGAERGDQKRVATPAAARAAGADLVVVGRPIRDAADPAAMARAIAAELTGPVAGSGAASGGVP